MNDWDARMAAGSGFKTEPIQRSLPERLLAPLTSTSLDRWALTRIQQSVSSAPIRFALWDGFELPSPVDPPVATIVFRNRQAVLGWVWDPELYFGEAYMFGGVEIRGDLVSLLEAIYRSWGLSRRRPWWLWQKSNDSHAAKENVHHHYDLGNEFYRLWLDREMVYTCAYFPTPDATLEAAQVAKMDLVCRKLRLKPGERVVEAGCGWGSLALFMAERYGVTVRAFNVSAEQIAYARRQALERGLADRVEFVEDDYRNVRGQYDAFVSVGHARACRRTRLSNARRRVIDRCADRFGPRVAALHRPQPGCARERVDPEADFSGCVRSDAAGSLRSRCSSPRTSRSSTWRTCGCTTPRRSSTGGGASTDSSAEVAAMFDATFVRAWDLYLAGSEVAFTTGSLQLFQVVFARGRSNALPWTRVSG